MQQRIDADPTLAPVVMPVSVLNEVYAHALEAVPEECCGLITGNRRLRHLQVVRCRNEMTRLHRCDPDSHPRDGTEAFWMNEHDYRDAEVAAESRGERVTCVYHSHVGCGAWFSELDQTFAAQPHFPFPEADHLVVAVVAGRIAGQALYRREGAPGFVGRHVVAGLA